MVVLLKYKLQHTKSDILSNNNELPKNKRFSKIKNKI